jgi:hypothetical protein
LPKHTVPAQPISPNVLDNKPEPVNLERAGDYIIELALDPTKIPVGSDAQRAALVNVGVKIPKHVTVEMVVRNPDHLVVMIPPKAMIQKALQGAQAADAAGTRLPYVPPEYEAFEHGQWQAAGKTNEDFYAVRVADYTFSFCR